MSELEQQQSTHGVINLLYSQLQGWFAYEQVLLQRDHTEAKPDMPGHLKNFLDLVGEWRARFLNHLAPMVGEPEAKEAVNTALSMLETIFNKMLALGDRLNNYPRHEDNAVKVEDPVWLVAVSAWWFFAQEHNAQGDLEYAQRIGDEDRVKAMEQDLGIIKETVGWVNWLFTFTDPKQKPVDKFDTTLQQLMTLVHPEPMKNQLVYMANILKAFGRDPFAEGN